MSAQNKNKQARESYPTDLTDQQGEKIRRLLPSAKSNDEVGGRPRTIDPREV